MQGTTALRIDLYRLRRAGDMNAIGDREGWRCSILRFGHVSRYGCLVIHERGRHGWDRLRFQGAMCRQRKILPYTRYARQLSSVEHADKVMVVQAYPLMPIIVAATSISNGVCRAECGM